MRKETPHTIEFDNIEEFNEYITTNQFERYMAAQKEQKKEPPTLLERYLTRENELLKQEIEFAKLNKQYEKEAKRIKEEISRQQRVEKAEYDTLIKIAATISVISAIVGIAFLGWKLL